MDIDIKKLKNDLLAIFETPRPYSLLESDLLDVLDKHLMENSSPTQDELNDLSNKFTYHPPSQHDVKNHERLRSNALVFGGIILTICPSSKERDEAIKKLQEVVMWANASIALNPR